MKLGGAEQRTSSLWCLHIAWFVLATIGIENTGDRPRSSFHGLTLRNTPIEHHSEMCGICTESIATMARYQGLGTVRSEVITPVVLSTEAHPLESRVLLGAEIDS
jgi:hypothetical protein